MNATYSRSAVASIVMAAVATGATLITGCGGGSSPIGPTLPKATPTPTPVPTLGPVDVSTNDLQFTTVSGSGATMTFTVAQTTAAAGMVSVTQTACADGAAISFAPASAPSNATTSISVTAVSAPSGMPTHACTLLVTGSGGATATVSVDIRTTSGVIE